MRSPISPGKTKPPGKDGIHRTIRPDAITKNLLKTPMKFTDTDAPSPRNPTRRKDSGAILVVVLMMMFVLLGLGMTGLWLTSGNLQVAGNMNLRGQALFAAEAGLERARALLNQTGAAAPNINQLLAGSTPAADNVPTAVDLVTGRPNGVGAILIDTGVALQNIQFPPASFNRNPGTVDNPRATLMGTYTVWVRNDLAELRQGRFTNDTNAAVTIRVQGIAMDGRTNVVVESTMGPSALNNGAPGIAGPAPPSLCFAGKNACDDNSSTAQGLVIAGP